MTPPENGPLEKRAFTLVELLVVICIIAILTAILIPTLNGAHRRAQQAICLGYTRTVGNAVLAVMADHGNFYIHDSSFAINTISMYVVGSANYHGTNTSLPRCPLMQTNLALGGGYTINSDIVYYYPMLAGIPAPLNRTVLVIEGGAIAYVNGSDMTGVMTASIWGMDFNTFFYVYALGGTGTSSLFKPHEGASFTPQYHGSASNRGLNAMMVDGSATLLTAGSNGNFYYGPTHASISNGIIQSGGYVWDQLYYITNNYTINFPN
ncbi:MAG: prepilin-type N-terminal cleavage/methylation domain-containing protein [Chthoniobacterales bacterium]